MIKYAIPGMYELKETNFKLLKLMQSNKEMFYDDVEIEIVYGNFQFCIWDGGRIFGNYRHTTAEEIVDTLKTYNEKFNIPVRYVFTNCALEPKHYYNRFCNKVMELGDTYHNEVVLSDENLLDYLKENYKSYKFVSSTTKCLTDFNSAKQELAKEKFKLVCLDYNLNHNIKQLKKFTPEEKEKTEFLINAICHPGCVERKDHYYLNSYSHLQRGKKYHMPFCNIKQGGLHPDTRKHHLTYNDIKNIYAPLGFEHFKIEGRTWDALSLSLTYANYMVKPEYRDQFILAMNMR